MESTENLQQDPMMEIFMEECLDLVAQYETYLSMADEKQGYDLNLINEIFRITHTLKADATMMLFECIAVPTRAFERLLYHYREKNAAAVNYREFTCMVGDLLVYVKEEVQKILEGNAISTDGDELCERFHRYREELIAKMEPEQADSVNQQADFEMKEEPVRYYIGGQTENPDKILTKNENESGKNEKKLNEKTTADDSCSWVKLKNTVTAEEMKALYGMIEESSHLESKLALRFHDRLMEISDIICEYHELNARLLDWVTNAWMVPVGRISPKLLRTVEEMNQRLGKHVRIAIKGENLLIEKSWIDKVSGTLVHLIRNSVDHGIEDEEQRTAVAKDPQGEIQITYSLDSGAGFFQIEVKDDGRGVDVEKVRKAAVDRKLIKSGDQLNENEILKLMYEPGITTTDKSGRYSGRGVGMDAVWHNVHDLGGEIKAGNRKGKGLEVIITIPVSAVPTIEEDAGDEGFDSRR